MDAQTDRLSFRNIEHYADPTAYEALLNTEEEARHKRLMGVILGICRLSGFEITSHISVRDLKTGREWP